MYVFVLGTGRCGSSLVHEVLARHPDVGFISNAEDNLARLHLKGRWNNALFRATPAGFSEKGRVRFAPSEAYRLLDATVSPMISTPLRDLVAEDVTPWMEGRLRRFFEGRARAQAKPVFSHKFTGWPRAGFLHRIFPDARFIHVVRDGRAVANSWLQTDWWLGYRGPENWQWGPLPARYRQEWEASNRSFVTLAGICWKLLMDAFASARAAVPGSRWLEVRYEDILAEPQARFAELLSFQGLTWTRDFERGFRRYTFRSARKAAYETDLGPAGLGRLEVSLADHLRRYDYAASRGAERGAGRGAARPAPAGEPAPVTSPAT
ncbi:MAG: sulfotransferase family protein [Actinomycetota bacterium]